MFSTLDAVGGVVQFIGIITPFAGLVLAWSSGLNRFGASSINLTYVIAGLVSGAFIYGFGGLIRAQVSIARDSRRTANALERMAYRPSQQAPTSSRVRQLGKDE